jgi:homoserine O-succinyltransferase
LREEGIDVGKAQPDLDDLRIGLLNLMPDAALAATDRQFLRLVSSYAHRANLYVFPFTLAADHRSQTAQAYISSMYARFDHLQEAGLDAGAQRVSTLVKIDERRERQVLMEDKVRVVFPVSEV